MPGPVLGTTAANKAMISLALSSLPTGGHRSPRTTWNLSCDQCAQDEVPRAQKTVPGFDLVRTVRRASLRRSEGDGQGGETLGRWGGSVSFGP